MNTEKSKIRLALWTHTIDGRSASGTALVASKWIDVILAHEEFDVTFIHFERSHEAIYSRGVHEVIVPSSRLRFLNRRSLRLLYYFLTTKDRYDIMHWFQPRLYPFFWLAPAAHIVVTVHGAGDTKKDGRFILSRSVFNWTIRIFKKKIAVAIAGSEYSKQDIVREYRLDPAQVTVVNNGVEKKFAHASPERVAMARQKYHLPETFFLGVARFIQIKNVIRSLSAFEHFAAQHPEREMHYVNIGAKGPEKAAVDALVAQSPVRERIHFIGFVEDEDLPALYSAAHALVFPILNEGFGLPAIESMACGTPTIISETAQPEITAADALLVDVYSEAAIAAAMERIVEDKPLYDSLVESGYAKARSLSWEASGKKVVAIYKRLC